MKDYIFYDIVGLAKCAHEMCPEISEEEARNWSVPDLVKYIKEHTPIILGGPMKETTTELINKVLGEEAAKMPTGHVMEGMKYGTGQTILKECEKYEYLIASEGVESFERRVRKIVAARVPQPPTNTDIPESDIKA